MEQELIFISQTQVDEDGNYTMIFKDSKTGKIIVKKLNLFNI